MPVWTRRPTSVVHPAALWAGGGAGVLRYSRNMKLRPRALRSPTAMRLVLKSNAPGVRSFSAHQS